MLATQVDFQYFLSSKWIRQFDLYPSVKSLGSLKRRINILNEICCCNNHDFGVFFETVHFVQKLVKRRFSFSITKAISLSSVSFEPDCIDLVDKYHHCSLHLLSRSPCVFEKLTDSLGTKTNIQFDELTARCIYHRYFSLRSCSFGHKRFTCSGWTI